MTFSNYTSVINIELVNCQVHDMHFSRIPFADTNDISIKFTNCTFTGKQHKTVLDDGWASTTVIDRSFKVVVENCTFTGTKLANDSVLNCSYIDFDIK